MARPVVRRPDADLPYVGSEDIPAKVLFDTTVYIDTLQERMPSCVLDEIEDAWVYHCAVTEAELVAVRAALDPKHPGSPYAAEKITRSLAERLPCRSLTPDCDIWRREGRLRLLNDALIYLTALKAGCCVLTRNIADLDLLMQVGQALFYRTD